MWGFQQKFIKLFIYYILYYILSSGDYREFLNTIEGFINYRTNSNLANFILCGNFNLD